MGWPIKTIHFTLLAPISFFTMAAAPFIAGTPATRIIAALVLCVVAVGIVTVLIFLFMDWQSGQKPPEIASPANWADPVQSQTYRGEPATDQPAAGPELGDGTSRRGSPMGDQLDATIDFVEAGQTGFVTLSCPTCGGKLKITEDLERFACGYCGNEHVVKRAGGVISLSPVVEGIRRVQVGTDKTASELAMQRLTAEIEKLERQRNESAEQTAMQTGLLGTIPALIGSVVVAVLAALIGADAFLILCLAGIAFIGAFVVVYNILTQRSQAYRAGLDSEIATRLDELKRHKEIVDGK